MTDPDGPPGVRRQYATLEEFERAHGDDPEAVEEWLNCLRGHVVQVDDIQAAWLYPGMHSAN